MRRTDTGGGTSNKWKETAWKGAGLGGGGEGINDHGSDEWQGKGESGWNYEDEEESGTRDERGNPRQGRSEMQMRQLDKGKGNKRMHCY